MAAPKFALLGQQTGPTEYNLLQDSTATSPGIIRRIADQPLWQAFDPASGLTTKTSLGEAASSIYKAFVTQPLGDLKAAAEVSLYELTKRKQEQDLALRGVQPPLSAPTAEQEGRAQRGQALLLGMLVAGPAGGVVRAVGARTLLSSGVLKAAPKLLGGIINTGAGIAEGAAFGGTFGALKPLDPLEESRGQAVAYDMISGALFNGLFRGVGAFRASRSPTPVSPLLGQSLRAAVKNDAAAILAGRIQRAQMLPEPLEAEEIAARVAAGATTQGPARKGIFAQVQESASDIANAISVRFPALKKLDSEVHLAALKAADASTTGAWFGRRAAQYIEDGMADKESDLFWRGLIASRGRQIKQSIATKAAELAASGETISINGKIYDSEALTRVIGSIAIPELSAQERVIFSTNPAIARAKQRYAEVVLPLITDIRQRNGLSSLASTDEPFLPLVKATEEEIKAGARTTASPTVGFGSTFAARTTPGAKMALGQAAAYHTSGEEILTRVMGREFAVDRKNDFIALVRSASWTKKLKPGELGQPTLVVDGEEIPAAIIDIKGNSRVLQDRFNVAAEGDGAIESVEDVFEDVVPGQVVEDVLGRYLVPKPVARAWNELFNPLSRRNDSGLFDNGVAAGYHKFMDFNVGLRLASPVEVTAHSSRILAILARQKGVGDDLGAMQYLANRLIPWFGPRLGGLRSIYGVYDDPAALAMEARLAQVPGALPSRAFEGEHQGGIGALLGPKAASVLGGGRKFIFGLPEQEHGLHGFDIRARIAAALVAERISVSEIGRGLTDAELAEYLTQFGTYSDGVQSNIASWLRRSRLAPFAGGQAGIVPGEVRGFFGSTNLPASIKNELGKATLAKWNAEVLWRGTIGTALMLTVVQKALTNRYPWENEPGHKEDLMIGYTDTGRAVYIPFTTLAPDLARAARITGARALAENFGADAIPAALNDLANTAITFAVGGPGVGALTTLATGNAPFITGPGSVLQVVPPMPTALQTMKERFLTAAGSSNPTFENILGIGPAKMEPTSVRIVNALTPGMEVGRTPLLRVSAELRGDKAEMFAVIEDRVNQAFSQGMSQGERIQYYKNEILPFPPEQRLLALQQMLLQDQQRQRSVPKNAAEAIAGGATAF